MWQRGLRLHHPLGRIACGPGWCRTRRESLRLPDLELWYVWRGRGAMHTRSGVLELRPGFCAIMRPGGIYDATQVESDPLGIAFIHFGGGPSLAARLPEFPIVRDPEFIDHAVRWIISQVRFDAAGEVQAGESVMGVFHAVLLALAQEQQPSAGDGRKEAQERLIRDFADEIRAASVPRMDSIGQLAKRLGVGVERASRLFAQVMGTTLRDFVLHQRLQRAQHLLLESGDSIGGIAEQLGFCDIYAFSRQFRLLAGMTPSRYRARAVVPAAV